VNIFVIEVKQELCSTADTPPQNRLSADKKTASPQPRGTGARAVFLLSEDGGHGRFHPHLPFNRRSALP
jgi:hypothetical protein